MYIGNQTWPIPRMTDWNVKNINRNTNPKEDTWKYRIESSRISGPAPTSVINGRAEKYPRTDRLNDINKITSMDCDEL